MFARGSGILNVRTADRPPHSCIFSIAPLLILVCLASGCSRYVRIAVSPEEVRRAAELGLEGDRSLARGDFYSALIKYLESAEVNSANEYVHNRTGICYAQLGHFNYAEEAFERASKLNSKYAFPYNNLGAVLFAQKEVKKAERLIKKAIKLKGDVASFHMNLGAVHLERKAPEKAIAEWRRALRLDPQAIFGFRSISMPGGSASLIARSYLIARIQASNGDAKSAVASLRDAVSNGFSDLDEVGREADFDPIRKNELFLEFIQEAALLIRLRQTPPSAPRQSRDTPASIF